MPDDFIRQWGTPGSQWGTPRSQWVNHSLENYVPLTLSPLNWPKPTMLSILLCLTPVDFTCQWGIKTQTTSRNTQR